MTNTPKKIKIKLENKSVAATRGWNIEVDGSPKEVGDDTFDLRKAMTSILETFNMEVEDHDIVALT